MSDDARFETTGKCPRCGADFILRFGALSRYDNWSKVCADCGVLEAMAQWSHPSFSVPPLNIDLRIDWDS